MSIASNLKQSDVFYDLPADLLELVASICTEKEYDRGSPIFAEHSASDELYVVADGEIEIRIDPRLINQTSSATEPQTIAVVRRGQSFGEMALLDEGRRSASARCASHRARLVVIPRDDLIALCEAYPQLGYRLMFNIAVDLSMKIRNADLQLREQIVYSQEHKNNDEN